MSQTTFLLKYKYLKVKEYRKKLDNISSKWYISWEYYDSLKEILLSMKNQCKRGEFWIQNSKSFVKNTLPLNWVIHLFTKGLVRPLNNHWVAHVSLNMSHIKDHQVSKYQSHRRAIGVTLSTICIIFINIYKWICIWL